MFDLNDVWRSFDLKASQAPSQWRNKYRRHLDETANLHVQRNGRNGQFTWATKKALFAYAAWVDLEFHDVVFEAFEAITENRLDDAYHKHS